MDRTEFVHEGKQVLYALNRMRDLTDDENEKQILTEIRDKLCDDVLKIF